MSLFTTPTFVNLAIVNGIGVVAFLALTVLSAWIAAKGDKNSNSWWLAMLMSIVSVALAGYNAYNAYVAYDTASSDATPWAIIIAYIVFALFFFSMIFGIFSTTKEKSPENLPARQY